MFKYQIITDDDVFKLEGRINRLAIDGWESISIAYDYLNFEKKLGGGSKYVVLLRRKKD